MSVWIMALTLIALGLSPVPSLAQSTRATFLVQGALDDMEEYELGGGVDWNSSDIEMTSEGGGVQTMGFRFTNVTIPAGAVITGAWLQFTADEANSEATTLTIRGEAADNSAQFQDASFTVSSRTRTTA
ncbi:MAG TPA: RTX toxin, partial [Candidatus Kapabacteria bacterium]|nr:RTX toxin [Candidatus Kapabacteria bacterium]